MSNTDIRDMTQEDLPTVIKLIHSYDEDDAESAEASYNDQGLSNQFIITSNQKVIGVSGFHAIEGTDHTAWLSWTYLDKSQRKQGLGKQLVQTTIEKAKQAGCRKLFVKISDYDCPDEGKIYAAAYALYQSLGFKLEVVNVDFYDDGEDLHILGLALTDQDNDVEIMEENPIIQFRQMFEIEDTDGAYGFTWTAEAKKMFSSKKHFNVTDLQIGQDAVRGVNGRKIFLNFPSNLPLIHEPLQKAGFVLEGELKDYYEAGLHDLHYAIKI